MSIDRIGPKAPSAAPVAPAAGRAPEAVRPFEVCAPEVGSPPQAAGVGQASSALERLRSREVDLPGYVDLKVQEATAHLATLPPAELEAIRAALRDRLAADPTLVDLVRTAAGAAYEPPGEP